MNEEKRSIWTSVALANALNDIGVNVETIQLRRATWLYIEALFTIKEKAMDSDVDVYIFGSQTEGTTTDDMHSDMDMLKNDRTVSVIYDIADWKFGPVQLFMVMDMSSPPQCCCLQGVQLINPELVTERKLPDHHIDAQGRVFVKNTLNEMGDQWGCDLYGISHVRHGPSRTLGEVIDLVRAFHCAKLPADCQFIFRRPKPGHWPSQELLTQLKDSGVFLVPTALVENTTNWDPGHHLATLTVRTYGNSHELYWRLSTNFMERLLMFDLTITQIKVYVVMKMIRKEFCMPLVGDRLSTFHLKTALLYSVERSPHCVWKDDNLIQCLKLCLTTLRRWLKVRYCPHYTTANVNLFAGKLRWNEFPVLVKLFTDIIRNDVSCLHNVKMDDLGNRLSSISTDSTCGILCEYLDIFVAGKLFQYLILNVCVYMPLTGLFRAAGTLEVLYYNSQIVQNLETMHKTCNETIRSAVSIVLPFHYSIQASMKASLSIGQNQILPEEIFTLCNKSLTSDVTSSRLKLASIYFSLRRFKEADAILRQVDALISNKVMHYRPFREFKLDSDVLKRRKEFPDILQNEIAMCTIFSRHEINCVPGQLVAEFYRTVTKEDAEHRHQIVFNVWLDHAVVDSKTYMYYLKYLTSQLNGFISDKHSAFDHLQDHVFSDLEDHLNKDDVFSDEVMLAHFETSLNLLGHCWELEGGLSNAWHCYHISVRIKPHNNAAYWHMFRMIGGLIYGP
ncbi:uncharacterized protein LOC127859518 [Dreissena polymorpha]|uniref:uncharacterized protein LOC127859518 n=1 Tax=Dreissena polymorpha TaxID=45954 RepID=UPI002263B6DA|nr:uncharacterized protein LOC127859518 [Dreissena polymorpha]